ncbi:hypothetical protein V8F20_011132 [Naviculisporaceae sp. PSN 640]
MTHLLAANNHEWRQLLAARDDPPAPGAPVGLIRWTLDETCRTKVTKTQLRGGPPDPIKGAVVAAAVAEATIRSRLAASTLKEWKTKCPEWKASDNDDLKVRAKQCELFMGPVDDGWATRCDMVIQYFEAAGKLQGPVGHQTGYTDSPEWKALEQSDDHHLNFVVYCAPWLSDEKKEEPLTKNKYYYNYAHKLYLENDPSQIVTMRDQIVGTKPPDKLTLALTVQDRDLPTGDRMKIPASITIHPIYLDIFEGRWLQAITPASELARATTITPEMTKGSVPISFFSDRLSAVMHHEIFHLRGLGNFKDKKGGVDSYDFRAILGNKDNRLPDFYMFLALQIELFTRNIAVQEDGLMVDMPPLPAAEEDPTTAREDIPTCRR